MLSLRSEHRSPLPDIRRRWYDREERDPRVAWLAAGIVVVGLGVLTWAYLGPDLRRYLKIHSM